MYNMKPNRIIIVIVSAVIAVILYVYLLNDTTLEGNYFGEPNYSDLLMVREQMNNLKIASELLDKNGRIPLKDKMRSVEYVDSTRRQLESWYKERVDQLSDIKDMENNTALKKMWSNTKILIDSAINKLDTTKRDQESIVKILQSVIANLDAVE
jgi:hypothetical protein